ncbi:MAG: acyl-CoA dehydrogenase family protein [Pseudomonadota bacterium]
MNLEKKAEDEAFEAECEAFLNEHLTQDVQQEAARGAGVWAEFDLAMKWQKILHAHGKVAPSWPSEFGGCGWNATQIYIWNTLCASHGAPRIPAMGLQMCGPVLMKYGTQQQKDYFLPRILSGEDFWCQGYSEPGAGSDLAALKCSATRDGDDYIVNGTKIWTTYAQYSNWIFCLVRTKEAERPQKGISFLLIPMNSPGISVTPIISISGDHEVNQVFFDDVRVPCGNLVGEENEGWSISKYLLEHERGGSFSAGLKRRLSLIKNLASLKGAEADYRHQISDAEIRVQTIDLSEKRIMAMLADGTASGSEASMLKLQGTEMIQYLDTLAVEILGPFATPDYLNARLGKTNFWLDGTEDISVMGQYLNNRAATIYGGSSEIQRNILAKFSLGL